MNSPNSRIKKISNHLITMIVVNWMVKPFHSLVIRSIGASHRKVGVCVGVYAGQCGEVKRESDSFKFKIQPSFTYF